MVNLASRWDRFRECRELTIQRYIEAKRLQLNVEVILELMFMFKMIKKIFNCVFAFDWVYYRLDLTYVFEIVAVLNKVLVCYFGFLDARYPCRKQKVVKIVVVSKHFDRHNFSAFKISILTSFWWLHIWWATNLRLHDLTSTPRLLTLNIFIISTIIKTRFLISISNFHIFKSICSFTFEFYWIKIV